MRWVWGQGCICHAEERALGKTVICKMQGLLLPFVKKRAEAFWDMCKRQSLGHFQDGDLCAIEVPGASRLSDRTFGFNLVLAVSREYLQPFFMHPLSLAYITTTEDLADEREVWLATPESTRHRVSNGLFDVEGLAADVEMSICKGTFEEPVHLELEDIKAMPITEEQGETPHASMHCEALRAPAALRAWKSASARMNPNLAVYDGFSRSELSMFDLEWSRFKRVRQVNWDRRLRPSMCTYKIFIQDV